jgi:ABC-type multidrug transport system ATPase subunit
MKQRAKLAFALVHRPNVLVLDEPMANLDADGIGIVRAVMDEHRRDGILVVATNDRTDIDHPDQEVALHASH